MAMGDNVGAYYDAQDEMDRRKTAADIPTPAELAEQVTLVDAMEIAALVQRVTTVLRKDWSPDSKKVTVDVGSTSLRVIRAVEAKLAAAGWRTTYGSEQRDGSWLIVESP